MRLPVYQQRNAAWDARDAKIRELQESGVREIRVLFLQLELMQDLGDRRDFRLNRCAAILYNADSIQALPVKGNQ